MADINRVSVKIYGEEYTISGDKPDDQIRVVAKHVDSLMAELSRASGNSLPLTRLAVLSAVNISNDLFDARKAVSDQQNEMANLKKTVEQQNALMKEAETIVNQYRTDAEDGDKKYAELQRIFNLKNMELNRAKEELENLQKECESLKKRLEEAPELSGEESRDAATEPTELERKYKELENSFFDIQMENIQLKNELDQMKKSR